MKNEKEHIYMLVIVEGFAGEFKSIEWGTSVTEVSKKAISRYFKKFAPEGAKLVKVVKPQDGKEGEYAVDWRSKDFKGVAREYYRISRLIPSDLMKQTNYELYGRIEYDAIYSEE